MNCFCAFIFLNAELFHRQKDIRWLFRKRKGINLKVKGPHSTGFNGIKSDVNQKIIKNDFLNCNKRHGAFL